MKLLKTCFLIAALSSTAMVMQSCCGYSTCDCFDEAEASIRISFNLDSTKANYFSKSSLSGTCFIQIDTVTHQTDTISCFEDATLIEDYYLSFNIYNNDARKHKDYYNPSIYKIVNDSLKLDLTFDQIHAKGSTAGRCNCYCYTNEGIDFRVNGVPYNKLNRFFLINKP